MRTTKQKILLSKMGFLGGIICYFFVWLSFNFILNSKDFSPAVPFYLMVPQLLIGPFSLIIFYLAEKINDPLIYYIGIFIGISLWGIIGTLANYYVASCCNTTIFDFRGWLRQMIEQLHNRPDGIKFFFLSGFIVNIILLILGAGIIINTFGHSAGPFLFFFFGPSSFIWFLSISIFNSPILSTLITLILQSLLWSFIIEFVINFIK